MIFYLGTHDSISVCSLQAFLDICIVIDSSVGNHRNIQGMLNFFNELPVACSHCLFILLFCSAVDSQQTTARLLHSLCQRNGRLVVLQHSHFAEQWNLQSLRHSFYNPDDEIWLRKQKGTVVSSPSYSLRATKV